jgi:hypothetical protein
VGMECDVYVGKVIKSCESDEVLMVKIRKKVLLKILGERNQKYVDYESVKCICARGQ